MHDAVPSSASTRPSPRVALVIGSGSVKCAAALGMYRQLVRDGIGIDLVVGCSGGALYATLIALGIDPEVGVEKTRRLWTKEVTSRRNMRGMLQAAFPKLMKFTPEWGLKDDTLIMRRLQEAFGDATFADTKIPLYLTATDFANGEQVVVSQGRIIDGIRASIALPFAFSPWKLDGRLLADGFLSDPLPVGVAIREGARVIVAMGFESPYQQRIDSAGRFAFQFSSIMANNLLKAAFAFHGLAHHSELIAVIPQFTQRVRLFDVEKLPYIIEEGERAMALEMPYLRRLLGMDAAVSVPDDVRIGAPAERAVAQPAGDGAGAAP
jgi:NTE family protein